MSDLRRPDGRGDDPAEEEQVRRLLEGAGPRPEVPAEDLAEITAAFRAAWQEHVRQRQVRRFRRFPAADRRLLAPAAAALLLAALGLGGLGWWWSRGAPAAAGVVARVESVAGSAMLRAPGAAGDAASTRLAVGAEVPAGAELETAGGEQGAAGHAALRLAGGPSLRLDAGSRVRLASASVIRLERGAVYVDSGDDLRRLKDLRDLRDLRDPAAVAVETPFGVVRDVGTRFEVRLLGAGDGVRVRVREGAVRLEKDGVAHRADAGAELAFDADGAAIRRRISGHGPEWSWVLAAAPPLEIEGLTLEQFLDRVAAETGWTVRYADRGLAASARSIVLHGTVGGLTPEQAPGVVLPGAGLEHEVADGVLVIRTRRR